MVSAPFAAQARDPLYTWIPVNKPAPPPEMLMENQQLKSLKDFKGNVVLLNLWATWCTPCLKELPTLDKLDEKYAADGLAVITLSIDTFSFKQLRAFIDKHQLELPYLAQDRSGVFRRALVTRGLPVTYLIGRDGTMLYRYEGATDWLREEQEEVIRKALGK